MSTLSILNDLADTSSRLAKEDILRKHKNNKELIAAFHLALDTYVNFYVKQVRHLINPVAVPTLSLSDALESIRLGLSTRKYTGGAALDFVSSILSSLSQDDQEVVVRVIERDLRCGVNIATVNKCWKNNQLQVFSVMLCDRDASQIKFPCFAQCKADGTRAIGFFNSGTLNVLTRNGKPVELHGCLDATAASMFSDFDEVDGELVCIDPKTKMPLPRKTGNGIINKAIRGTISKEEAELVHFVVWDLIDHSGKIGYSDRLNTLKTKLCDANGKIRLIDTVIINSMAEADSFYQSMRDRGEEGAILKNFDNKWQGKRVKSLYKMKDELVCELRAVGWNYGTGRNANRVGSVIFQSEDGLLEVNVSGFEDEERDEMTANPIEGRIASIVYNTVIQSKEKGAKSTLFLPRFNRAVGWRLDKSTANYFDEIQRGV